MSVMDMCVSVRGRVSMYVFFVAIFMLYCRNCNYGLLSEINLTMMMTII